MNFNPRWKSGLKLFGIALLLWLLSTLDWGRLGQTILGLRGEYLAAYFLAFLAMALVRTERLHRALVRLGYAPKRLACYRATIEPGLWGLITPGRLGELSRVGYVAANGCSLGQATAVVLAERAFDLSLLLLSGGIGLAYLSLSESRILWLLGMISGSLLLLWGCTRWSQSLLAVVTAGLDTLQGRKWARVLRLFVGEINTVMARAGEGLFWYSVANLSMNFLQIFFLARAFAFEADVLVVIFSSAIAALVSLLPISVGGLGTREATYIAVMAGEGVAREEALLFSLLDGLVFNILMLFLLWLPLKVLERFSARSRWRE
jgi:uncharacterized protein (TIRG00374 family)